ncbi:MAG: AAA family ATPase [Firmicutes bacterium]|jgi:anion-transporting  ArsA/GET3 family ATPase|nr:AAA family ATPase [Bacillota bacterium]
MDNNSPLAEQHNDADRMLATDVLFSKSVIVTLGPGGIGKTTLSAALSMAAAKAGKRVCVITIDPAKRLADALGIADIGNAPKQIEGDWSGKLDAIMLDAAATFDDLVKRYSKTPSQAEAILQNRLYANLTTTLAGTHEYMAAEKLFEIHTSGNYDLIVVDTPPSRHAIDFLDAPENLFAFLDNKVFRLITNPNRYLKAVSFATQFLLKTIARVAGAEIVEDAIEFFRSFDGMEDGFRQRAMAVTDLLRSPQSGFVLASAPQKDVVIDTKFFVEALGHRSYRIEAVVLNKLLPEFDTMCEYVKDTSTLSTISQSENYWQHLSLTNDDITTKRSNHLARHGFLENTGAASEWDAHLINLRELSDAAQQQKRIIDDIIQTSKVNNVFRVPLLENDVHDIKALAIIADILLGEQLPLSHG